MAALTHLSAPGRPWWVAGGRLAAGVERAVAAARSPEHGLTATVPVQQTALLAERGPMLEPASRLRGIRGLDHGGPRAS
jgi:hypothetical protein